MQNDALTKQLTFGIVSSQTAIDIVVNGLCGSGKH